jgi:hypothetical protein
MGVWVLFDGPIGASPQLAVRWGRPPKRRERPERNENGRPTPFI